MGPNSQIYQRRGNHEEEIFNNPQTQHMGSIIGPMIVEDPMMPTTCTWYNQNATKKWTWDFPKISPRIPSYKLNTELYMQTKCHKLKKLVICLLECPNKRNGICNNIMNDQGVQIQCEYDAGSTSWEEDDVCGRLLE